MSWSCKIFFNLESINQSKESKVDDINIEVRNQIELNLMSYESKVYWFDPVLVKLQLKQSGGLVLIIIP